MDWLVADWDQGSWVAAGVGLAAGVFLAILGYHGLAELGGATAALGLRWALWQIPPPGRSRAPGTPPDGWPRIGRVVVVVLLFVLIFDIAVGAFRG